MVKLVFVLVDFGFMEEAEGLRKADAAVLERRKAAAVAVVLRVVVDVMDAILVTVFKRIRLRGIDE